VAVTFLRRNDDLLRLLAANKKVNKQLSPLLVEVNLLSVSYLGRFSLGETAGLGGSVRIAISSGGISQGWIG
jgi:recombinational DNA repair protein (RecF pathway)